MSSQVALKGDTSSEAEGARLLFSTERSHGGSQAAHPSGGRVSRLRRAVWHCVQQEPLLLATLAGVAAGVVLGTALSFTRLSPLALDIIGLPGDLLMRTLKMLVLPLITASVMAGVCALRQSTADMGRVARYTLLYYLATTLGAVVLGIVIVNVVRPGRGSPFDQLDPSSGSGAGGAAAGCHAANVQKVSSHAAAAGPQHSPVEAFLGVIKSAFPDNIFQAAVNMNVLGIITVSLLMGAALSCMGPEAAPMVTLINVFNEAIGKVVNWVIWTSPVGIASLIATSICRACHLGATLAALGLFIGAVLLGLLLWGFLVLPLIYVAATRRNPARVYRGFSQAMATAFGTDSSNATLPITMRSAVALGCDPRVVQFFLPLGTTVNMNGTALYEAVTVIFIAQAHGVELGAAGTVIVALTATLAAVGAAGIPSAGLVTMLMVLQAVDLAQFAGDIAIILAVDWFLDRCRTVVNVLGDAFGTVIIDHHARNWVVAPPAACRPDRASDGSAGDERNGGGVGCGDMGIELGAMLTAAEAGTAAPVGAVAAVDDSAPAKDARGSPSDSSSQNNHNLHNHHRNHHSHHHGVGPFHHHHHSHSDPDGVREGLLAAGDVAEGAEPRSPAPADPAGYSSPTELFSINAAYLSGVGGAIALGHGEFRGDLNSGSGSGPAGGPAGHLGGSELHHRHPHATPAPAMSAPSLPVQWAVGSGPAGLLPASAFSLGSQAGRGTGGKM